MADGNKGQKMAQITGGCVALCRVMPPCVGLCRLIGKNSFLWRGRLRGGPNLAAEPGFTAVLVP
jgi:hypothetical protein